MQKLFENWRSYLNETLLLESRKGDASKAIVKNLDNINWAPQEPGDLDWKAWFYEELYNWVDGLRSSKHLVGLAGLVHDHIYYILEHSGEDSQTGHVIPRDAWGMVGGRSGIFKEVEKAYNSYIKATDRRMKISAADFFNSQRRFISAEFMRQLKQTGPKRSLIEIFNNLDPLDEKRSRPGNGKKEHIEPIEIFNRASVKGPGSAWSWYDGALTPLKMFIYFSSVLEEIIRVKGYTKDPEVIEKAAQTTKTVIDNQFFSVSEIQSMHAGCVVGCSTWCISQVPTHDQEVTQRDDEAGNRFAMYKDDGDSIYIIDFKHLQKHAYQKVSLQYNIKIKMNEPYEVIDCGTNMNDAQRKESAVEIGAKLNFLAFGGQSHRGYRGGANLTVISDFEDFLRAFDKGPGVKTWGYYEKAKLFTPVAKKLGIILQRPGPRALIQWKDLVGNTVKNIHDLATQDYMPSVITARPAEWIISQVFVDEPPPVGIWKTIHRWAKRDARRGDQIGGDLVKDFTKALDYAHRNHMPGFDAILKRLTQEAGGANIGAARNLIWDLVTRHKWPWFDYDDAIEAGGPWDDVVEEHWELDLIYRNPNRWLKLHLGDLVEEIINVLINISPYTLASYAHRGLFGDRLMKQPILIRGMSDWLTSERNRDWLAAEIRRILEENIETTIKLVKAITTENPTILIEETWKLFYNSFGKEIGHLIDKALGSDDDRALELARDLQENRKKTSRILISIKRPTI